VNGEPPEAPDASVAPGGGLAAASVGASAPGPLDGVRVVELGVWVAGPAAGGIMADWGADVVKVEPPLGDPQRSVFGAVGLSGDIAVPPFEVDNRGKRSVVLDLRSNEGRADLELLLATADVFVSNLRPGALERLGLDHDEVCRRHPRLVYGSITGYGLVGQDRDSAGYDIGAFWARSGLAHTMVPPGEHPPGLRSGMGDHQTGMTLVAGVMARLLERERTGRGGLVATSLLRTGMYSIAWDMGIQLRFDRRESTRDRFHSRAPLVNNYRASDDRGFWLICLEADRHWPKVVAAVDRPALAADERFVDARARLANCEALIAELDAVFGTRPLAAWADRFDEHDVWWAPVQSITDVIADAQAQPGIVDMEPRPGEDAYRAVNTPVDFAGYTIRPGRVPTLGEHTDEVLTKVRTEGGASR
jgi:crotonobetainyl-CoA:carnitine CoA-transferase CaiB-like acyl-CoA transferase